MCKYDVAKHYARVETAIAAACRNAGRARADVLLVAVSKFQPKAAIAAAAAAGQRDFGENYLQEALAKMAELAQTWNQQTKSVDPLKTAADGCVESLRWHFTGHLQTNKAARAAGAFCLIHTLDSMRLADALQKACIGPGIRQPVLMEINIGAEPQKAGIMPEKAADLALHVIEKCPNLELRGLMCLPPVFDSGDAARPFFAALRKLRDALSAETGCELPELSMGMSGDFNAAIAEGATIVRIGTSIFGPRPARN